MKYGIDRNSPDEIRRQQSEKAYKELYARFETMVGLKSPNKKDDTIIRKECRRQPVRTGRPGKVHIPVTPKPKRRKMGL